MAQVTLKDMDVSGFKVSEMKPFTPGVEWHREDYCGAGAEVPFSTSKEGYTRLSIVSMGLDRWYIHDIKTGKRFMFTAPEILSV